MVFPLISCQPKEEKRVHRTNNQELWKATGEPKSAFFRNAYIGSSGRRYLIGNSGVYAFSPNGDLLWRHEITMFVSQIAENHNGNLIVSEMGKGGGGILFCLSNKGHAIWSKDLWEKQQSRVARFLINRKDQIICEVSGARLPLATACYSDQGECLWSLPPGGNLVGLDANDNIYIQGGSGHPDRILSRDGGILWESMEGSVPIQKDENGFFLIPLKGPGKGEREENHR